MIFSIDSVVKRLNKEISIYRFGQEPTSLYDPIDYIMALGGKRMRPLLTVLGHYLYNDDISKILRPAIAVEVFHNFTLMHDDIMDDAPLRRGKLTVHQKWNTNVAILSGDTMLVKAYELLSDIDPKLLPDVLKEFNKCAAEVCEGQQFDMEFEKLEKVSIEDYLKMIRLKTSVLLGFSLYLGSSLGGASEKDARLLYDFGVNVGMGFQIQDDILDVYGSQDKVGKQVAGDIVANKKTYMLITAMDRVEGKDKEDLNHWLSLSDFNKEDKIRAIIGIYDSYKVREAATIAMNSYFDHAMADLTKLKANLLRKGILRNFVINLMQREG